MGAGVVKPQENTPRRPNSVRIHVAAAPSFSTTSTSSFERTTTTTNYNNNNNNTGIVTQTPDMSCESCSSSFTIFKRKKSCRDCGRFFCQDCIQKFLDMGNRRRSFRQCKNCSVLMSGNFNRQDLMKWKIKDLRILLTKKNISTEMCTEKPDLIDLLVMHFGSNSNRTSLDNSQHTRHVDELVERMRDTISEASESPSPTPPTSDTRSPTTHDNNQTGSQEESQTPSQPSHPLQNQSSTTESEEERRERLLQRQQEEMRVAEELMANELRQERFNQQTTGTPKKRMKIDDVTDINQIDSLSVQQLKEILVTNFVDYKGCVEKYELMDRVRRLWREHQNNKKKVEEIINSSDNPASASNNEEEICKICMDAAVNCVLLECGHMVSCTQCGRRLAECPVCRQYVVRAVHVFKT